jgi:branched-chain amino acid transport system ATP-binding protein
MGEILRTEGLTKSFGGLTAVNEVSFSLEKGEVLGLIGPNGAGKTTLINLISGVYLPTQGRIFFEGRDISQWHAHRVNNLGIARTFQVVRIFSKLTALENVLTGLVDRVGKSPWGLMLSALGSRNSLRQDKKAVGNADELLEFVGLRAYRDELAANLPCLLPSAWRSPAWPPGPSCCFWMNRARA